MSILDYMRENRVRLYYRSDDGETLSLLEGCERAGVSLENAPLEIHEAIIPPIEERRMGRMLGDDEPITFPRTATRRYRLWKL